MLGLIKKDFLLLKNSSKSYLLVLLIYLFLGFIGEMDFSFILPFMSVLLMMMTFSYDTFNHWDSYVATFPKGRAGSVRAKYITTLILILLTSLITFFFQVILICIKKQPLELVLLLEKMLGTIFTTITILCISYPAIYKFGLEKARISIFLLVFGIVIIGSLLASYIDLSSIFKSLSFLENYLVIILILLTIIMVYTSYKISLKIFSKKEF